MSQNELAKISEKEAMDSLLQGKALEYAHVGEIIFKNHTFSEDLLLENCEIAKLSFQNCTFLKTFTSKNVKYKGTVLLNDVDFGQTTFQQQVVFDDCVFEDEFHAKGAIFESDVSLKNAVFAKRAAFPNTLFQGKATFEGAEFKDTSRFEDLSFQNSASFENAIFHARTNFRKARFRDNAYFRKAKFLKGATFENASMGFSRFEDIEATEKMVFKVASFEKAYFHRAIFHDLLSLRGCTFNGNGHFNHMKCKGKVDMVGVETFKLFAIEDTHFEDEVDISRSIFHHDFYLRGTTFEKLVNFENTVHDLRLDFSQVSFHGEVKLFAANPNVLVLEREQIEGKIFSAIHKNHAYAKKVYLLLKRGFEFAGNHEDADWAYYKFRQAERKSKKPKNPIGYFRKFCNFFFFDLGCGYGTKPFHVTILAAFVILLFSFLFWGNGNQFLIDTKPAEQITFPQAFYISAMTFTTLGTEGIAPNFHHWIKYCLVLEGFLGLFLMTVFVGIYTRKMAK